MCVVASICRLFVSNIFSMTFQTLVLGTAVLDTCRQFSGWRGVGVGSGGLVSAGEEKIRAESRGRREKEKTVPLK